MIIGLTLFTASVVAEIVRGSIQSLPRGANRGFYISWTFFISKIEIGNFTSSSKKYDSTVEQSIYECVEKF